MAKPQRSRAQTDDVCQEVGQNPTESGCAIKYGESIECSSLVNSLCDCVKVKVENYEVQSRRNFMI